MNEEARRILRASEECEALFSSIEAGNVENVKQMLDAKTDVNGIGWWGRSGSLDCNMYTALLIAARSNQSEIINLLAAARGDINKFLNEHSPLHEAANQGNVEALRALLSLQAEPNALGAKGSPLHLAAQGGHLECVKLLLNVGAGSTNRKFDESVLFSAASAPDVSVLKFFADNGHLRDDGLRATKDGRTLLHTAAAAGNPRTISLLLQLKGDVNAYGHGFIETTPLLEACGAWPWSEKEVPECLEALLAARADAAATDSDGRCVLHFAARRQNTSALRLLLGHFKDVDQRDNAGETPLHACAEHGRAAAARLLIEKRASVHCKNKVLFSLYCYVE